MRIVSVISFSLVLSCQTTAEKSEDVGPTPIEKSSEAEREGTASEAAGDKAWEKRTEESALREALRLWTLAVQSAPSDGLWVKLSRAHYLLADAFLFGEKAPKEAERKQHFAAGYRAAEEALKLNAPEFVELKEKGAPLKEALLKAGPTSTAALYWYSVNIGKWSQAEGPLWVMRHKNNVRLTMERVRRLNATFFYAAPERYFGALEAATTGLLGGSLKRSEEAFERALKLAPEYFGNKVVYAEFYAIAKGDRALFERLLNEVVAADTRACDNCAPENDLEKQKAKRLLSQVEVLF